MKKTILAAGLCLVIAVANAQTDKAAPAPTITTTPVPAATDNKNAPEIKFEFEQYDFGTIKQGESVTYDFAFTNSGKEPLIITEAHGSCGCTVPQWPKEPVVKGGKGTIHVVFNSTGKMGNQDKTVTITSNAKSGQKVLHLKGNVEAPPATPAAAPVEQKQN